MASSTVALTSRHTAGTESPHNWLARLGTNLATFCDIWSSKVLTDTIWGFYFFLVDPATSWLPTTSTLHPYTVLVVLISYLVKNYLCKKAVNSTSYALKSRELYSSNSMQFLRYTRLNISKMHF